jgi:two-component system phosphate regulon sensor histidine kinase PhoR
MVSVINLGKMFKNIQTFITLSLVGTAILTLAIFALIGTPRIQQAANGEIVNELYGKIALAAPDLVKDLKSNQPPAVLQALVMEKSKLSDSRITLIDNEGKVLADSGVALAKIGEMENHLFRPEIQKALKNGKGYSIRYSTTVRKDLIYAARTIKDGKDKRYGFLRFAVPSAYARDITGKIQRSLFLALIIAVLVAVFLSFLLGAFFSRPIVRLSKMAEKIAAGRGPKTVIRRSKFELGSLEESIGQMSQRMAENFQKLAVERGRIGAILSSMNEGVLAVDQNGKIILANPAVERMFGVIELDILGKMTREGIRNNEITDMMEEVMKTRQWLEKEINIVTPIEGILIAHTGPIQDKNHNILGVVCVLYNVTELRKLEKYRSDFVANVSHELKTPLTAIRNYVETLLGGAINDQQNNQEFLRKIDKHAGNLSALIDDILEISKLESKKELGLFSMIDVTELMRRAVETIQVKASKKKITLEKKCGGEGLTIQGIEDHVYRALLNLLDNAINYTNEGGKIEISCDKNDGQIEVRISDNGIGIAKEHLPRIFERFYRVDKARSRELGGTGLGLAIVKHVMNIHNGTVTVESEEGRGSKFTLRFPASI